MTPRVFPIALVFATLFSVPAAFAGPTVGMTLGPDLTLSGGAAASGCILTDADGLTAIGDPGGEVDCPEGVSTTLLGGSVGVHLRVPIHARTSLRLGLAGRGHSHNGRISWMSVQGVDYYSRPPVERATSSEVLGVGYTAGFVGANVGVGLERELREQGVRPFVLLGGDLMPGVRLGSIVSDEGEPIQGLRNAWYTCQADCERTNEAGGFALATGAHVGLGARFGETPFLAELRFSLLGVPAVVPRDYPDTTVLPFEPIRSVGLRVGFEAG